MKSDPWFSAVSQCEKAGEPYVIATVMGAAGSTPREPSTKMVITREQTFDTIGGGRLEFLVIQIAHKKLADEDYTQSIDAFPLAAEAKQCCGGFMSVLLEPFRGFDWFISVFGAGHVSQKLVPLLSQLPCRIDWYDRRSQLIHSDANNVFVHTQFDPVRSIENVRAGSDVLIMTHDHALDFELTAAALSRQVLATVGTIGSQTKAERFKARLGRAGIKEASVDRWCCPVGLPTVKGKLPIEIAISIVAQLLEHRHREDSEPTKRGLHWKDMKRVINDEAIVSDA
jgi:xanthine dehydrogenase accessory factor